MIAAAPHLFGEILDRIDVGKAAIEIGKVDGVKSEGRQVVALLVQHAIERQDTLGDLARQLRKESPRTSTPRGKSSEPIELPEEVDPAAKDA
ncbi:hypothetical protein ACC780_08745 [Rhizobium ruizarguesonis]